jgi:hypothetical protein
MPNRLICDKARSSPTLQALSNTAERAWWRLLLVADDYGRYDAETDVLLAQLFQRRPAGWTVRVLAAAQDEWESVGLVHRFATDEPGRVYGHIPTWAQYQRQRESKPKFPDPPCGGLRDFAAKCGESRQIAAYPYPYPYPNPYPKTGGQNAATRGNSRKSRTAPRRRTAPRPAPPRL